MYDKSGEKSKSGADKSRGARNVARASVYLYVVVMGGLFVYQTWYAVAKYLDRRLWLWLLLVIVEEVSMTRNMTAVMPPITFCLIPGYKTAINLARVMNFSSLCDPEETTDFVKCIDDMSFTNVSGLVPAIYRYPSDTATPFPPPPHFWLPASFNLALGSCFTYRNPTPDSYTQTWGDYLIFNMGNPFLKNGWSFFVMVHNPDSFMPSLAISNEYAGQHMIGWKPELAQADILAISVTHKHLLSTEERRCEPDPNYNIVKCMEEHVERMAGCKSPWDLHKNESARLCETYDDFERLFQAHWEVANNGAMHYEMKSGCLQPCDFMEFDVSVKTFNNPMTTDVSQTIPISMMALSLQSTNQKVATETYHYQLYNLVGEIGGCLGMFLGVSLISLYQMSLGAVANAYKYVKGA